MSATLDALLDLLDLEPIENNIYRGRSHDIGSGRVYGGQVLAQALVAAARTVDDERTVHSLHGYFILPGDVDAPIVYFVDRLRDGRSFTTRQITAIQHGRAIFSMAASFQVREGGVAHQLPMPEVPPPEDLVDELELLRAESGRLSERARAIVMPDRPFEFRAVDPVDPIEPAEQPPVKNVWLRAIGEVGDDPLRNQAVLAYASDYGLLGTALLPHRLSFRMPRLQAATLDHAMWFHRPFRADEWLLYAMDSPSAGGARGFTRGNVFTRDGTMVASVVQEGLIRVREEQAG